MPDNPFNALLDPSKQGTITGFLGGLMGNPTASQAAGGATASALQDLSALKDQGLNNQQALLKFFQTPAGHDYFTSAGPDGLKQLTDGLQSTTAPAPTLTKLAAGDQLYSTDPNSRQTSLLANNPKADTTPADVKSFQYFTQLSGLPTDEIKRLANLKVDPSQADKETAETQAIDKLVANYGLAPQLGEAMKAGQVKVIPLKNGTGQDTGSMGVVDLTGVHGPTVQIINPANNGSTDTTSPGVTAPVGGTTPANGAATGVLPPAASPTDTTKGPVKASDIPSNNPKYFGTKASMFLASGIVPSALSTASSVAEQVNPKMIIPQGAQAEDRQVMVDTLRSDLAAMGQLGGGIGVNKGVLEGYLKLAPTGSASESPHQAVQRAIRLSEHINQEIDAENATYNNAQLPMEDRKAAQARIQGWQRVKRDLPSDEELSNMESAIRNGTAGASTVSGAVGTILDAGGKALTETKKQAGEVTDKLGIEAPAQNFETMSAQDLAKVNVKTLDRTGLIKFLRRSDALKRGVK